MRSRSVPLRRAALLLVVWLAGVGAPVSAQSAPTVPELKRTLPDEELASCPTLPAPTAPSPQERAEAGRLLTEANQAALLGDNREARDLYRRIIELDPTNADVAYRLARTHEELGETRAAGREYCRFVFLAPGSPDAQEVRARIVEILPPSTPLPAGAIAQFQQGITLFEQDRPEDAETAFTRALGEAPSWADVYYNRAVTFEAQSEPGRALRDYQRYLEIKPGPPDEPAVRERIATLRGRIPGVTPTSALLRGIVVPGLGQFSTGRPVLGVLILGGAGAATLVALQTEEEVRTVQERNPFGEVYEYQDTVTVRSGLGQGLALAAAVTLLGAVEAYFHASRRHDEATALRRDSAPSRAALSRPTPFLRPAPNGGVRVGVDIRLGSR